MAGVSVEKLLERLSKGKAGAALLLLGTDTYLRDLCRQKLIEALVPEGVRDWGVSRFSAADDPIEQAIGQAQMLPMLAARQVVFITEMEALESLGEQARDKAIERLAAYLDDPAPFTVMVLEAAQLDQRMKLAKTLLEKTLVVSLSVDARSGDSSAAVGAMVQQMARELKVELERDAAEELTDLLNAELGRIRIELEKLATYVGERRRITRADVEKLVVSEKKYSVWELAEALAGGRSRAALEFLESVLREGEQPAQVVGALAWMFRKLIEAQELPRSFNGWQAARPLGMRPESAELALRESRKISRAQLLAGLEALYEADSRLKSGVRDPQAVMEFLAVRLTRSGEKKAVAR